MQIILDYDTSNVCRHCLAYVYELLLRKALNDFQDRWNSHQKAGYPPGVPDDLYHLPLLTGKYACIVIFQVVLFSSIVYYAFSFCRNQDLQTV